MYKRQNHSFPEWDAPEENLDLSGLLGEEAVFGDLSMGNAFQPADEAIHWAPKTLNGRVTDGADMLHLEPPLVA